jgi:NADPH:quinone reductase-like Zn-dependent oxidoreductase
MTTLIPATSLQLRSLITSGGMLELSLVDVPTPEPGENEVLVRIEGAPINPSDLGLLIGPADLSTLSVSGGVVSAKVPDHLMRMVAARADESMPVGNEGGGVVVKAGSSPAAQALLGKTVGVLGGAMYSQYRAVRVQDCLVLPEGTTSAEAASCFVNPLTALAMTETMRAEGHKALVHTAAASNLGQMLNKICLKDGIDLVNVVRSASQAKILNDIGAKYIVDSSAESFQEDLVQALVDTGATIAFDAIGGGKLAGQLLNAMEVAANKTAKVYSRYGSTTYKQVYIYGGLDTSPTILNRAFGMSWGLGGFLLTPFLLKAGPAKTQELKDRVAAEIKTTFASHYTAEISLAEALKPEVIAAYNAKATGTKYLINPAKG